MIRWLLLLGLCGCSDRFYENTESDAPATAEDFVRTCNDAEQTMSRCPDASTYFPEWSCYELEDLSEPCREVMFELIACIADARGCDDIWCDAEAESLGNLPWCDGLPLPPGGA